MFMRKEVKTRSWATKQFLKVVQLMQGGAASWTYNPWLLSLCFSAFPGQKVTCYYIMRECFPWEAEERGMGKEARERKCNYKSVLPIYHLLVSRATDCCLTSWDHFLGKLIKIALQESPLVGRREANVFASCSLQCSINLQVAHLWVCNSLLWSGRWGTRHIVS